MDSTTRIQLLSDLHLESPAAYDIFDVATKAPFLALLGDIGYVKDDGFFHFLQRQLAAFKVVFLVFGNHEPYHSTWDEVKAKVKRFQDEIAKSARGGKAVGELVLLDQTRYDISPNLTILGCTLFSEVAKEQFDYVSFGLNDFYHIRGWSVEGHNEAHSADVAWLNQQVESISSLEPNRRIIIFTHYSPSTHENAVDPKHMNSNISSGFTTDLSDQQCWKSDSVALWAFGHTHYNCNYRDSSSEKRVMTNQRGYYFAQSAGFDEKMVIEVEDTQ
ncbi:Metallo-dependent phosphatase-like protein [Aspergillus undulatus]|uniref:Metallo-dependent phosphatase-like protein n=1 Tax=Aspergillus undulatus TaxID=1810928 RepID=UPI003CCCCC3F